MFMYAGTCRIDTLHHESGMTCIEIEQQIQYMIRCSMRGDIK